MRPVGVLPDQHSQRQLDADMGVGLHQGGADARVAEDQQDVGFQLDIGLAGAGASRSRASTWSASPLAVSSTMCVFCPLAGAREGWGSKVKLAPTSGRRYTPRARAVCADNEVGGRKVGVLLSEGIDPLSERLITSLLAF